jgi:hypothetical protein
MTMTTLEEMNRQTREWDSRAMAAQSRGAQAYERLLSLAEASDTGQARIVAKFVAATYNGHAFSWNLFELRGLDVELSDDCLLVLDCLRWGKADLYKLVPDGQCRIETLVADWGLQPSRPQ